MGSYNEPGPSQVWFDNLPTAPDQGGGTPAPVDQGAPAPQGGGGAADLNALYQQYFGRDVDPSGAATFAGQDANAVIQGILGSQEYANIAAAGGGGGGAGGLPPGAMTALAGMDTAPAWLPPAQYAQYGFNAQGKKEKEGGLSSLQPQLPEGTPAAPAGFTYAGSNKVNPSDDSYGTLTHSYNDEKGGTLTIDQYGNTNYTPGAQWYEEQLAKHPDAIRSGYRNQQYLARGPLDSTIDVSGVGPVYIGDQGIRENLYNPNTKQLYKDPSGNFVNVYYQPESHGFDDIVEKAVETGMMAVGAIGGGIAGGPAGAAAGAAGASGLVSLKNETPFNQAIRNAAMSAGTAYIGGQLMPTEAVPLDQITNSTFTSPAFQLTPEGAIAANSAISAAPTVIENGLSTLTSNVPTEPLTEVPTVAPTAPPVEPDIAQVLQQTYPDANIGAPVAQAPLTAAELQAANLPMDAALQPGTISAATNNVGYLPPSTSSDVLLNTAQENLKNGVSKWWQITGNPVVDAGIRQAVYGSGMGALTSAIGGGSASKGALYGGIAGGVTGTGGEYLGGKFFPEGFNPTSNNVANAGIRAGLYGAANSGIATKLAGGNAGKAALIGGGISGIAGAGLQAADDYFARQYEAPNGVRRFETTPETIRNTGDTGTDMSNIKYGQGAGTVQPYDPAYDLNPKLQTGATPYGGAGTMNPAIEQNYGGVGNLNPNLNYTTEGLANTVQALSDASGIPIDPAIFNATGALSATDSYTLDQAITNAEEIGMPYSDILKDLVVPFLGFVANPPGKNQASTSGGGGGSAPPKKPLKVPKRAGGGKNWDNYLLHHIVNAGNVYTPEATGYQSVGYKEGGMIDGVQHYDVGGSISSGLTNLFRPVEQNIIQPVGQAAPWLKDVLPYAAMAASPFLGTAAAAGIGALGSGFGTTPGAGFNMKRALMGGIASYGMSNIGSGLAEAGMTAQAPMAMGSIEEPLVGGAMQYTPQNPATTGGFWEQITNAPEKAKLMQQGAGNLMKGGDAFTTAANAFGTRAGMGSAGMAIMGGTGVLGVDEADAQNQAVAGTNSSAAQQQAIQADKRNQAKINAQNAVAAHPFHFAMGGMLPNPPDDQTGIPSQTPMQNFEHGGILGYAMGGMPQEPRFLSGGGDGMSDSIKANIDGNQEARLADGEFVIPADVVSHLGNGSSKAGAKQLYSMMDKIRQARTGRKAQGREINPNKFMPV